jgi:hypothetical protein
MNLLTDGSVNIYTRLFGPSEQFDTDSIIGKRRYPPEQYAAESSEGIDRDSMCLSTGSTIKSLGLR